MKTLVVRKSQPIAFPGWRLATAHPTTAQGTPITAATTPSPAWRDAAVSGMAAAKDSSASRPSAIRQALAGPGRKLMIRTLRGERSGNVTAGNQASGRPQAMPSPAGGE